MERCWLFLIKTVKMCLEVIGIECEDERIVHGITCDSRICEENDLFVCIQGSKHHGCEFIQDARRKKAIILCEGNPGDYTITHPKKILAQLIRYFYDEPSQDFTIIAVTGTNGKSSITSYIKQMLTTLGHKCLRIGTDMIEFEDEKIISRVTTPGIMENLNLILEARKRKIQTIILELSSHAIEEERMSFMQFDRLIYTNLSLDHLDYHQTLTHYQYTKFKARNYLKIDGKILLNLDDEHLKELLGLVHHDILGLGHHQGYRISHETYQDHILSFQLDGHEISTTLAGSYNLENVAMSCLTLYSLGYEWKQIQDSASTLQSMPGRMERIIVHGIECYVDYAHTPSAIERICKDITVFMKKELIIVMGCGGDRDRKKRPLMLEIAASYAKLVIVTQDNPRYEDPREIIKDMMPFRYQNVVVVEKRTKAIQIALNFALNSDIIVVAGKGNEQVIQIKDQLIEFNDMNFLRQL